MSATEETHESGSGQALNLSKDIATTSTSEDNAVTSEDRQNVGGKLPRINRLLAQQPTLRLPQTRHLCTAHACFFQIMNYNTHLLDSDQPVEYYCGVGRCRPNWLQRLRDARFFVFLLCCNTFIQGALVSGM